MIDTRARILGAAEALIGKFGFGKISMEEIAREAGISRAAVYLHFKNKNEIGIECADKIHARLLTHLRQLAELDAPVLERIRRILIGRVLFAIDFTRNLPAKFEEMFVAIRPSYMVHRERYFTNESDLVLSLLKEGVCKNEVAVVDLELTALALVLSTNALMPFSLNARQLKARREIEERVSKIAELVVAGIPRPIPKPHKQGAPASDRNSSGKNRVKNK
ncbi:TetR/AcrR family transcriptional regulator [Alloacidobacterium sp.]|uniref:TetR/AcrR family transcriptional regulator n=1 Tax=Alloacidobacterium sp. TaxID=2951999 RepID=UPI002D310349|nr:TetR/AcrR family transcriptional regulator [Alloacidobacterium sp.]HYK34489.1 TetR/AcrR family transcriptional regulator [Alloacidobacterium sp.]